MIKFKLVDNRTRVARKIKELQDQLEELPKVFMKKTADEIVFNSPVDTGTYMDAHNIGIVGSLTISNGKPRNQPWQPYAQTAIERLYAQIDGLDFNTTKHYISNNSAHAWKVEYELQYAPYTITRAKAQALLDDAIREVMNK